ncbi:CLAVATA3/ESR (CLE)-related protein 25 [Telopea speciosissima]|uniref:CLAVATA3/ESR (CLE)-related protein 25 n=1 Tax=Telopea speciosissima TaxID=54955 RepID=UPI001CC45AE0|nr:CLAVATA3/ESR (CLE)-related protein 25 [Telopea speciosissima]
MDRHSGSLRDFLRFLVLFVGFIGFLLLVEIQASEASKTTTTTVTSPPGNFKQLEQEKRVDHPDLDLNYMSKRRVPNGPDPIHNRKAGKSKQPPGRA